MKLLIAEDNSDLRYMTSRILDMWKYKYDIAHNGKEVVNLAQKNEGHYDLCLMDIDMPIMNGYEAAQVLRKTTRYFPIIAVTANPGIKENFSQEEIDCIDFVLKESESQ